MIALSTSGVPAPPRGPLVRLLNHSIDAFVARLGFLHRYDGGEGRDSYLLALDNAEDDGAFEGKNTRQRLEWLKDKAQAQRIRNADGKD